MKQPGPIKRTPFKRKRTVYKNAKPTWRKSPKQTKKEAWLLYGIEYPGWERYTNLRKSVYWYLLSNYVRKRDFNMFKGECVSCGKRVTTWNKFHAGHFISVSRGGFGLLFDKRNVNGECSSCNNWDKQKLGYERTLDARYGTGTAQLLKDRHFASKKGTPEKEWSQMEYEVKIKELQNESTANFKRTQTEEGKDISV